MVACLSHLRLTCLCETVTACVLVSNIFTIVVPKRPAFNGYRHVFAQIVLRNDSCWRTVSNWDMALKSSSVLLEHIDTVAYIHAQRYMHRYWYAHADIQIQNLFFLMCLI